MTSPPDWMSGLGVSRETADRLDLFAALFQKWSKAINLIAPSTQPDFWRRHILDSLQIARLATEPKQWADLGSGGGFPGIITAIVLAEEGAGWVNLVESNNKKASFLRTAIRETGARASVWPIRIEEAPARIGSVACISARALADLDTLLDFAMPWARLDPNLVCFFHKGRDYRSEIANTLGRWSFDLVEHQSVVETGSVILEIRGLTPVATTETGQ